MTARMRRLRPGLPRASRLRVRRYPHRRGPKGSAVSRASHPHRTPTAGSSFAKRRRRTLRWPAGDNNEKPTTPPPEIGQQLDSRWPGPVGIVDSQDHQPSSSTGRTRRRSEPPALRGGVRPPFESRWRGWVQQRPEGLMITGEKRGRLDTLERRNMRCERVDNTLHR